MCINIIIYRWDAYTNNWLTISFNEGIAFCRWRIFDCENIANEAFVFYALFLTLIPGKENECTARAQLTICSFELFKLPGWNNCLWTPLPTQPTSMIIQSAISWMIDECEATSNRSFNCSNIFICTVLCTNTFSLWVCSWNYLSSIEWGNARPMKWIMQLEFTRACQVYSGGICPSPQSLLLLLIVYSGM